MSRGPILTLVAVLALGAILLGVNLAAGGSTPTAESAAASAPAAAPAAAPARVGAPEAADADAAEAPAAATAPAAFPAKARYDGVTEPRAVPVTLWVEGDRARAYVCDNKGIESWLNGTARDGVVAATGKNGARLDGRYTGGTVNGNVQVPGYPAWTYAVRPR